MARAHGSQHMGHANMGDEACWRRHESGLEGRHDEWSRSSASPGRPAGALAQRRLAPAANATRPELGRALQLERVELFMPLLHARIAEEVGYAPVKVRTGGVDGCGVGGAPRLRESGSD